MIIAAIVISVLFIGIRIKLADGKLHFAEDRAGIVVIAGLAVLFGQAEMAGGKHKLYLALHTDNRENADSNVDVICADAVDKASVEAVANTLGDSVDTHTAMAVGPATLDNLAVEANRRSNLDNDGRKCRLAVAAQILLVEAEGVCLGVGGKDRNVLFAAEKNYLLVEGAKALYLLHSAAAHTSLERYAEVIAHGDLVKALVEGYRLDIDVRVDYLDAFTSYRACSVDNLLSHIAEVHANVLEAILIARGIENLIHAYAAKLFLAVAAKPAEQAVFFIHYNSSLFG